MFSGWCVKQPGRMRMGDGTYWPELPAKILPVFLFSFIIFILFYLIPAKEIINKVYVGNPIGWYWQAGIFTGHIFRVEEIKKSVSAFRPGT